LALIAVVGKKMRHTSGIMARVSGSLSKENINIEVINQGPSETNIILGVSENDYERGVRALYREFVKD